MVDEKTSSGKDEFITPSKPNGKGKVDLFPALADRRMAPMNSIRQNVPTRIGTQISIFSPASFDEALDIVECLRGRAATTISLDNMKKVDANRLVDFVAGASAALDGDFHKLTEVVYLFCPSNIKISAPNKTQPKSNGHQYGSGIGSLDFLYPSTTEGASPRSTSSWAPM